MHPRHAGEDGVASDQTEPEMASFYLNSDEQERGPFTAEELRASGGG